jgi:hypothetical protein
MFFVIIYFLALAFFLLALRLPEPRQYKNRYLSAEHRDLDFGSYDEDWEQRHLMDRIELHQSAQKEA